MENSKLCALTFDDGPSEVTAEILDILEKHGLTASFFVIGNRIKTDEQKEIMRRAVKMGCTIENHSYSHRNLTSLCEEEILEEYRFTQELIYDIVGDYPRFFRAPGLSANERVFDTIPLTFANGKGGSADWNSNPSDPVTSDLETRTRGILDICEDGLIYLLHDCSGNHLTPKALEVALPQLIGKGYGFVNLRRLFELKGQALTPTERLGWTRVLEV